MNSLPEAVFRFAHDVGSPLMIVMSLAELLKDDGQLTESQRADVMRMHEASREIQSRVDALRDLALRASSDQSGD